MSSLTTECLKLETVFVESSTNVVVPAVIAEAPIEGLPSSKELVSLSF